MRSHNSVKLVAPASTDVQYKTRQESGQRLVTLHGIKQSFVFIGINVTRRKRVQILDNIFRSGEYSYLAIYSRDPRRNALFAHAKCPIFLLNKTEIHGTF
jgi:hypothetical protein